MNCEYNSNTQFGYTYNHNRNHLLAPCVIVYSAAIRYDGVELQMTLLFFTSRYSRIRAAAINIYTASFHAGHASGGGHHNQGNIQNAIRCPDNNAWFVKVVCTLCVRKPCFDDACLSFLRDGVTPSIAFEVVRRLKDPRLGFKFFEFCRVKFRISHFFSTYNLLVRSLCEMGFHGSAKEVLDCMRVDGQLPPQSMIAFLATSFAEAGKFEVSRALINQAEADKVALPSSVCNKVLSVFVRHNRVDEAMCLFREHLAVHSRPDTCSFNIVIRGLCKSREVDQAYELFQEMESFGCRPDVITYNTLINGLCKAGKVDKAHVILKQVQFGNEFSPDVVTYTSLISGYFKLGRLDQATIMFSEMIRSGTKPNTITFNILIDGFGKSGNMCNAKEMHDKMVYHRCHPDIVTLTSLIDGYCRIGQVDRALEVLLELKARNLSPNEFTFGILINALCKESRLQEACEFLNLLTASNVVPKPFVYNPVIDGFCKAGKLDEANMIVADMEKKRCRHDKMTYTILIIGHCVKGRIVEAISIFNKMLANGCTPDDITVSSFISCLLKAGKPSDALRIRQLVAENCNSELSSIKQTNQLEKNDIPVAV